MKKIIAFIAVLAFVITIASTVYAQVDNRTPAEKLASGRAYLKLLDKKIIKYRNMGNDAMVKKLQAQKKGTIARMKVWKAQAASPGTVAPPPPPPVAVRPAAAPSAGLFGLGLLTSADIGYVGGYQSTASILAGGSLVLADPLASGTWIGLSADAVEYKVGLGLVYGKDSAGANMNAVYVSADGILNLPAEWMGGVDSYLGAQIAYPVYKTDVTGVIGGLIYAGIKGDVGLGGDSYAEVGYGAIRRTGQSTRGIDIKVGQEIML